MDVVAVEVVGVVNLDDILVGVVGNADTEFVLLGPTNRNLVTVVIVELAAQRNVCIDVDVWEFTVPVVVVIRRDLLVGIFSAVEDLQFLNLRVAVIVVIVVIVVTNVDLEFWRFVANLAVFDELERNICKAIVLAVNVDVIAVEVDVDHVVAADDIDLEIDSVAEFDLITVLIFDGCSEREVIVMGDLEWVVVPVVAVDVDEDILVVVAVENVEFGDGEIVVVIMIIVVVVVMVVAASIAVSIVIIAETAANASAAREPDVASNDRRDERRESVTSSHHSSVAGS